MDNSAANDDYTIMVENKEQGVNYIFADAPPWLSGKYKPVERKNVVSMILSRVKSFFRRFFKM